MKFDVVVGNPPYQESREDTRDDAIYNYFYDLAEKIAPVYILISPARFLFNAGSTDKNWNRKMLKDKHIKITYFNQKSAEVFPNTDIMGGIAILMRDSSKNFGEIGTFTAYKELNSILSKVEALTTITLDSIMSGQGIYRFTQKVHDENPEVSGILPKSHQFDISTGVFRTLDNILFFNEIPNDGNEYMPILGRYKNKRVYHYIRKDYVNEPIGFNKYRVVLPNANGSGAIGAVTSTPIIGEPLIGEPFAGFTQTFISIGQFNNINEAENALKYVKSKFARTMLGILKVTQHNPKQKWEKVPLQDFTNKSDIDWSKPVSDIDQQLYKKYGLSKEEISFIEEKVKEME